MAKLRECLHDELSNPQHTWLLPAPPTCPQHHVPLHHPSASREATRVVTAGSSYIFAISRIGMGAVGHTGGDTEGEDGDDMDTPVPSERIRAEYVEVRAWNCASPTSTCPSALFEREPRCPPSHRRQSVPATVTA